MFAVIFVIFVFGIFGISDLDKKLFAVVSILSMKTGGVPSKFLN